MTEMLRCDDCGSVVEPTPSRAWRYTKNNDFERWFTIKHEVLQKTIMYKKTFVTIIFF